ncbi:hypothetical protein D9M68_935760 [compost metagenome]
MRGFGGQRNTRPSQFPAALQALRRFNADRSQLFDNGGDLVCRGLSAMGQTPYLFRHHGKAAAVIASARRLDGGIERQ